MQRDKQNKHQGVRISGVMEFLAGRHALLVQQPAIEDNRLELGAGLASGTIQVPGGDHTGLEIVAPALLDEVLGRLESDDPGAASAVKHRPGPDAPHCLCVCVLSHAAARDMHVLPGQHLSRVHLSRAPLHVMLEVHILHAVMYKQVLRSSRTG